MRRPRRRALLCWPLLLAAACSPLRLAEAVLVGDHFVRTRSVAYGLDARQRLDVYRPRTARRAAPVVVFLYGGRWQGGSRDQYRLLGDALTRRGWVTVVPDYRLYPDAYFPAWVADGASAVRWTYDNIHRFGGDPSRIVVVGHSAGAHTAALLALDERYLRAAGVPAGVLRGAVSIAGPVDTVWTDPDVQALMGPPGGWPATYPATHVAGGGPPLLLLHGADDGTVSPANSRALAELIEARGGCARSIVYDGVGHIGIVVALAVPRLGIAPVVQDVARFVRAPEHFTCPDRSPPVTRPPRSSPAPPSAP